MLDARNWLSCSFVRLTVYFSQTFWGGGRSQGLIFVCGSKSIRYLKQSHFNATLQKPSQRLDLANPGNIAVE